MHVPVHTHTLANTETHTCTHAHTHAHVSTHQMRAHTCTQMKHSLNSDTRGEKQARTTLYIIPYRPPLCLTCFPPLFSNAGNLTLSRTPWEHCYGNGLLAKPSHCLLLSTHSPFWDQTSLYLTWESSELCRACAPRTLAWAFLVCLVPFPPYSYLSHSQALCLLLPSLSIFSLILSFSLPSTLPLFSFHFLVSIYLPSTISLLPHLTLVLCLVLHCSGSCCSARVMSGMLQPFFFY